MRKRGERGERVDGIGCSTEHEPTVVVLPEFSGTEQAHTQREVADAERTSEDSYRRGAATRANP